MSATEAWGMFFTSTDQPLERRNFIIDDISDDDVVVKVAGCGVCHTDLGFISGEVGTKHDLPLILGHEISGTVEKAGKNYQDLLGKQVIIPAVLPCGECELCKADRDNICQHQLMPGNDFNGGFASHIVVPARFLCQLADDLGKFKLQELSVVADAITTPYQSMIRSGLVAGDLAIVIGTGGVGLYMAQHAHNAGAIVIALDIDPAKIDAVRQQGADYGICTKDMDARAIKSEIRALVKEHGLPKFQWKIFETSGSAAGQNVAFSLLTFAATVGIIGFTMAKLEIRLSNIMAFDADLFGNWGCSPKYYPAVVDGVLDGSINLQDNIVEYPLSRLNEVIELAKAHKLSRRAIMVPDQE
ncbi:6-hydroxycylohex-1-en-1-carbonyl-CoA dehydrogenase [hydrothermal vent metagenome]|uniref:6-hydroxycylohex-1-en-1-carbonyl-CoA dehydrogenase n=1 Tax=hydrothermal vent metagenome TaxID=652676 RepID=A0A3B0SYT9_9ZZZZ